MTLVDPSAVLTQAESTIRDKLPGMIAGSSPPDRAQSDEFVMMQARARDSRSRRTLYVLAQVFISLVALFSFLYFVRVLNYKEGQTIVVLNSALLLAVAVAATFVAVTSAAPSDVAPSSTQNQSSSLHGEQQQQHQAPVSLDSADPFGAFETSTGVDTTPPPPPALRPPASASSPPTIPALTQSSWLTSAIVYVTSIGLFWWTFALLLLSLSTVRD
jgi:hypothetical protein